MSVNNFNFSVDLEKGYDIGITVVENFIFDINDLSSEKKMVLLMLRRYVGSTKNNETGLIEVADKAAFPSLNNLCMRCGISKPTVIKCLDFLEWMQWITKTSTRKPNGDKGVNNYTLHVRTINICLDIFKEHEISFKEIEEYFDCLYKHKNKGGAEILKRGCIFLSSDYHKDFVQELISGYKKKPKKKRENTGS